MLNTAKHKCSSVVVAAWWSLLAYLNYQLPPTPNTPPQRLQSSLGQPRSKIAFADESQMAKQRLNTHTTTQRASPTKLLAKRASSVKVFDSVTRER